MSLRWRATPSQLTKGLFWGGHCIDTSAVRLKKNYPGRIRMLNDGKNPLDLRRAVRRHRAQADGAPRHVACWRVGVYDEEQVGRAVEPETSVDTLYVERLVRGRGIGVDEERLDKSTDDRSEGGSRAFDGRFVAPHCRVLEGDRSCRGVSVYSKRTMTFGHTCRAMTE